MYQPCQRRITPIRATEAKPRPILIRSLLGREGPPRGCSGVTEGEPDGPAAGVAPGAAGGGDLAEQEEALGAPGGAQATVAPTPLILHSGPQPLSGHHAT